MKIYISGGITGLPRPFYHHKFSTAEDRLKARGHKVINPVRQNEPINNGVRGTGSQGGKAEDMSSIRALMGLPVEKEK